MLVTLVEGDPKVPISIAPTPLCRRERAISVSRLIYITLDPYLKMLSVK